MHLCMDRDILQGVDMSKFEEEAEKTYNLRQLMVITRNKRVWAEYDYSYHDCKEEEAECHPTKDGNNGDIAVQQCTTTICCLKAKGEGGENKVYRLECG